MLSDPYNILLFYLMIGLGLSYCFLSISTLKIKKRSTLFDIIFITVGTIAWPFTIICFVIGVIGTVVYIIRKTIKEKK